MVNGSALQFFVWLRNISTLLTNIRQGLSNGGIHLGINYWVLNETKQDK